MLSGLLGTDLLETVCARIFPDRFDQHLEHVTPISSRQHEMVSFVLDWAAVSGRRQQVLIARRYLSTVSWWRVEDMGKAQRELTVSAFLHGQGFPAPYAYGRVFDTSGDCVLFEHLDGVEWAALGVPFQQVAADYAAAFGHMLAMLHAIRPTQEVADVLPVATLPRALANLSAIAVMVEDAQLEAHVDTVIDHIYLIHESEPVLLHGDYHFGNALIGEAGLIGVIDWEFSALGDPRWDVASAYMQFVECEAAGAANVFLQAYMDASGRAFDGPPIYNVVTALQHWAISEWLIYQRRQGAAAGFALAEDLAQTRDLHRQRAEHAMRLLSA